LNNSCKFFMQNDEIKSFDDFPKEIIDSGSSIYEVIRVIDGKPLFLKEHIVRLENSAKKANLKLWISKEDIKKKIFKIIDLNKCYVGNIKFIFNYNSKNNFLLYFIEHHYPSKDDYENGVKTILFFGERHNPNAKIIDNNFREKVDIKIKEKNVFEALLVDRNGNITEGSRSNVFFVDNEKIFTAPLEQVLPGTTRQIIFELCKKMRINLVEKKIDYRQINNFDAVFISGTSPKILPVSYIDDVKFNSSKNDIVLKIMKSYDERIHQDIENFDL
jgi:branched-chain amino acid aminotransferase